MATIKSYTDLSQSRKLAEILPLESADMWWNYYSVTTDFGTPLIVHLNTPWVGSFNWYNKPDNFPCWSLAALLGVLPKYELYNFGDTIQLDVYREALATEGDETLLDLVVNMIIHLHELKML